MTAEPKPLVCRVSKRYPRKRIAVFGARDPRGADNMIDVWLDDDDKLHIMVLKAQRCYEFEKVVDHPGAIEVIQM